MYLLVSSELYPAALLLTHPGTRCRYQFVLLMSACAHSLGQTYTSPVQQLILDYV